MGCTRLPSWPPRAVLSKLLMLMAPYLKRWTYTRTPEQVRGRRAPPHPARLPCPSPARLATVPSLPLTCAPRRAVVRLSGPSNYPVCPPCHPPTHLSTHPSTHPQMQGGPAFKPPKVDVNSPDLYVPLSALWTYSLLVALCQAGHGKFKPDNMYPLVGPGPGAGGCVGGAEAGTAGGCFHRSYERPRPGTRRRPRGVHAPLLGVGEGLRRAP